MTAITYPIKPTAVKRKSITRSAASLTASSCLSHGIAPAHQRMYRTAPIADANISKPPSRRTAFIVKL